MIPNSLLLNVMEWLGAVGATMLLSLAPIFKVPAIGFRYARREGTVAFSLFSLMFILAFQYYRMVGDLPIPPDLMTRADQPLILVGLEKIAIAAAAMFAVYLAATLLRGQPLRSAGWNRKLLGGALRMGFGVALVVLFLRGKALTILGGVSTEEITALLLWLGIAFAEETVFRGYIQLRFQAWLGDRWGWLATAGLFTLWYLPGRLGALPLNVFLWGLLFALVQALILGWMMKKSNHVAAPFLYRAISGWLLFLL
ncbi:MAG: CPBP family intramembrane metalloprotease [Anaerolineaceae bacterium]|nr:CPBP family intramembrane metalloprotease [Anaerolineaceae bacterium]